MEDLPDHSCPPAAGFVFYSRVGLKEGPLTLWTREDDPFRNPTKVTLITPSCRPRNLEWVRQSIRFEYVAEWIIVYDGNRVDLADIDDTFAADQPKIKQFLYQTHSYEGNAQRNYALSKITDANTFVYFLDDDNQIHPDLYDLLDVAVPGFMYMFDQHRYVPSDPQPRTLRADTPILKSIDTAMVLVELKLMHDVEWNADYPWGGDGVFISTVFILNRDRVVYINKILCYHNLRHKP